MGVVKMVFGCAWLSVASIAAGACAVPDEADEEVGASAQSAEGSIDFAEYLLPSCDGPSKANVRGGERIFTLPLGIHDGRGRFAIMKSADGTGYEEWAIDDSWLYVRRDTTWAYQSPPGSDNWCDTQCGFNDADSCGKIWQGDPGDYVYTVYYEPGKPSAPAKFVKRWLALSTYGSSETFSTQMGIEGRRRADCDSVCDTNFSATNATRTVKATRLQSWEGFQDVIELAVVGGPGAGETYHYARGRGWIGFNGKAAEPDPVSHSAWPQLCSGGYEAGSICSAMGNPSSDCPCVGGTDNFCLYPASYKPQCPMMQAGGYCDPNGDGSYEDADWVKGYDAYKATCL